MSAITTHILDLSTGRPAAGVTVVLEVNDLQKSPDSSNHIDGNWSELGRGETDADGRLRTLVTAGAPLATGVYRLRFHTRAYFDRAHVRSFYPHITVTFDVTDVDAHYHVPILVSPFGYSTYRGS